MSAVYPTLPKLAVREGLDEEDLTDIDDEVFIRDGKNGCLKLDDDEGGVKRPLMAPRRKSKRSHSFDTYGFSNRTIYVPLCSGLLALMILLCLIILCIFIVNIIPVPTTIFKKWISHDLESIAAEPNIVPCTSLGTKTMWIRSLPKLTSESPLRSNDVSNDGVEDIIVGFSTGLDRMDIAEDICSIYFEGQVPCFGGVLALNGKTGDTIWIHWTAHAIFSVDCELDLTNDQIKDCIICGRGGILQAINGHDGTVIWELPGRDSSSSEEWKFSDIYAAKFVADIDGDEVGDIIASHSIQSREIHSSEIIMLSGVNGNIIRNAILPRTEQIFLTPQKLVHPDGESIFIIVTSSFKQSGGLYVIPQVNLMHGNLKLRKLHHDTRKGTLLPPILVDVTSDGIEDIVTAMFNSTIIVYNGLTFEPVWNYTVPNSEVISIPIPGYYNDDNVPDFMVKHQIGSGFPTYYYTVATIIDGKTGKSLLEKPMEDSLSREMSGLSVSVEGFGNDWFLHWSVDCLNYEGVKERYQFLRSEDLVSESRVDLCKLRFNSTLITNLYALSQHVGPPGVSLYFSEDWKSLEYNISTRPGIENDIDTMYISPGFSKMDTNKNKDSVSRQGADKDFGPVLEGSRRFQQGNLRMSKDYDTPLDANIMLDAEGQPIQYEEANEIRKRRSNMRRLHVEKDGGDISYSARMKFDKRMNRNKKRGADAKSRLNSKQRPRQDSNNNNRINGVQKQPPTGLLLPSISESRGTTSVDLIFSTFWLPTTDSPVVLIQDDLDCIRWKKVLSEKNQQYKQHDDIVKECLEERGVKYDAYQGTPDVENLKVSLGQMTIYRMKLECICPEDMLPNQSCKNISSHQSWSEHLGAHGNGFFNSIYKANV